MWRSAEVIDGGNFCTIPMPGGGGRKSDKANAVIVDDDEVVEETQTTTASGAESIVGQPKAIEQMAGNPLAK